MEKNLPFVSLSAADNGYNKLVIPFLGKLDDGNVFKNIIIFLFSLLSMALLIGGIYLCFSNLFGSNTNSGFLDVAFNNGGGGIINENYETAENPSTISKTVGSVFGLLLGFVISILTSWVLFSVFKKRTEQMKAIDYEGILSYVFVKIYPRVILLIGEFLLVMGLYIGIIKIIAALVGSYVYAPLGGYGAIFGIFQEIPGMEIFSESKRFSENMICVFGSYENFSQDFLTGSMYIVQSFLVLILFYIYKEIYTYILKLVTNFIKFLPKFAIPLAIRTKSEN